MPKFYKQNKKRIDPRYFLNETTDSEITENSNEELENMSRASALAQQGLSRQESGEIPPWEQSGGDGEPDVELDLLNSDDVAALQNILRHLNTVAGGGNRGELFKGIMSKLGVELDGSHRSPGVDVPESDAEKRFS